MPFEVWRLPGPSAGPSRAKGRLRFEPLTKLNQLASRAKAERLTVAMPGLIGQARLRGVAVFASDPIVHEPQPDVGVAEH